MIKMIISDLDGTLLDFNNKVKDCDIKAINDALQQGMSVCLASGRKDIDIQAIAKLINPKIDFHRISQNGAFIFSSDNEVLHQTTFEPNLARKIYEEVVNEDVITILSTINTEYVEKKDEAICKIEERLFSPIEEDKDLRTKIGQTIHVSKIIITGAEHVIHEIQKNLQQTYSEEVDTYLSETHILDVMPKHINKGNAVKLLIDKLGVKAEEVACVGDSFNDIPMFTLTKNSFAMASAHENVKKETTFVVDTVAEAIGQILKTSATLRL